MFASTCEDRPWKRAARRQVLTAGGGAQSQAECLGEERREKLSGTRRRVHENGREKDTRGEVETSCLFVTHASRVRSQDLSFSPSGPSCSRDAPSSHSSLDSESSFLSTIPALPPSSSSPSWVLIVFLSRMASPLCSPSSLFSAFEDENRELGASSALSRFVVTASRLRRRLGGSIQKVRGGKTGRDEKNRRRHKRCLREKESLHPLPRSVCRSSADSPRSLLAPLRRSDARRRGVASPEAVASSPVTPAVSSVELEERAIRESLRGRTRRKVSFAISTLLGCCAKCTDSSQTPGESHRFSRGRRNSRGVFFSRSLYFLLAVLTLLGGLGAPDEGGRLHADAILLRDSPVSLSSLSFPSFSTIPSVSLPSASSSPASLLSPVRAAPRSSVSSSSSCSSFSSSSSASRVSPHISAGCLSTAFLSVSCSSRMSSETRQGVVPSVSLRRMSGQSLSHFSSLSFDAVASPLTNPSLSLDSFSPVPAKLPLSCSPSPPDSLSSFAASAVSSVPASRATAPAPSGVHLPPRGRLPRSASESVGCTYTTALPRCASRCDTAVFAARSASPEWRSFAIHSREQAGSERSFPLRFHPRNGRRQRRGTAIPTALAAAVPSGGEGMRPWLFKRLLRPSHVSREAEPRASAPSPSSLALRYLARLLPGTWTARFSRARFIFSSSRLRGVFLAPLACCLLGVSFLGGGAWLCRRWLSDTQALYKETFAFHAVRLLNRYAPSALDAEEKADAFRRETEELHEEFELDAPEAFGLEQRHKVENAYLDLPALSQNAETHFQIPQFPAPVAAPTPLPRLNENRELIEEIRSLYEDVTKRIPMFSHSVKLDLLHTVLESLLQVSGGTDPAYLIQFTQLLLRHAFDVEPIEVARVFRRILEENKDSSNCVNVLLLADCVVEDLSLRAMLRPPWMVFLHGHSDRSLEAELLSRKEEMYRTFVRLFLKEVFARNLFPVFAASATAAPEADAFPPHEGEEDGEDKRVEELLGSPKLFQTDEERMQLKWLAALAQACDRQADEAEKREEETLFSLPAEDAELRSSEATEDMQAREERTGKDSGTEKEAGETKSPGGASKDARPYEMSLQAAIEKQKSLTTSETAEPSSLLPLGLPEGWQLVALTPRQAARIVAIEIRECEEVLEEEAANRKKAIEDSDGATDGNAELKRLLEVTKDVFLCGAGRLLEVTFTRETDELFRPPLEDTIVQASNFFAESVGSLYRDLERKSQTPEEEAAARAMMATPPTPRELAEEQALKEAKEEKKKEFQQNWKTFLADLTQKKEELKQQLLRVDPHLQRRPVDSRALSTLSADDKVSPEQFTNEMLIAEKAAAAEARAKHLGAVLSMFHAREKPPSAPSSSFSSSSKAKANAAAQAAAFLASRGRSVGWKKSGEGDAESPEEERRVAKIAMQAAMARTQHEEKVNAGYSAEAREAGLPQRHSEKATRTVLALLQELEYRKFAVKQQAARQKNREEGEVDEAEMDKALGGLDELDEMEQPEEAEGEADRSRQAFKQAEREERILQRQRALIEASKMRQTGAAEAARQLTTEVLEDELAEREKQKSRTGASLWSAESESLEVHPSARGGENGSFGAVTGEESEQGRPAHPHLKKGQSMQSYLDQGYTLVFNTPYRADEMLRMKGLKDGLDIGTDIDDKDVGDVEEEDEDDFG
ncbi:hypothetical protein TGARI_211440 [Toxoplasma gondii ARI]|uniref:Uncharacterized protein n=1 Tax=Toxoplasma gondii ARI TaxID=1074872 RepID=A0A139XL13_TOXGO|nr:hypothetical protein TGARI_211440 [Toxoplasma gondii ARI]